ncbi:hypothetical protein [Streptomyces sp. NBC_01565]|nr:hypothetical protein [Streptomyces sp. NBC_01565]MCX4544728.1 hypothetical protein [Streptomyces sp. NBC_01565]
MDTQRGSAARPVLRPALRPAFRPVRLFSRAHIDLVRVAASLCLS